MIRGNDFRIVHHLFKEEDDNRVHKFDVSEYTSTCFLRSSVKRIEVQGKVSGNTAMIDVDAKLLYSGSYGVEIIYKKGEEEHRSYYRDAFRIVEASNDAELPNDVVLCRDTIVLGLEEDTTELDPTSKELSAIDVTIDIPKGILTFRK